jgi:hypothetical protein
VFAVSAVVDARPSVVLPVTSRVPVIFWLPLTERLVDEALPNVEVPAVSVFTVAVVAVRLVISDVAAVKSVVKRLVDVAFDAKRLVDVLLVVELFVAANVVAVAFVITVLVKIPVVPFNVVIVDDGEVRSVMTALEIVVVASVVVPEVRVTKVGVVDTLIVEVPLRTMLDPAVSEVIAVFTIVFHCEVEAVSGIV